MSATWCPLLFLALVVVTHEFSTRRARVGMVMVFRRAGRVRPGDEAFLFSPCYLLVGAGSSSKSWFQHGQRVSSSTWRASSMWIGDELDGSCLPGRVGLPVPVGASTGHRSRSGGVDGASWCSRHSSRGRGGRGSCIRTTARRRARLGAGRSPDPRHLGHDSRRATISLRAVRRDAHALRVLPFAVPGPAVERGARRPPWLRSRSWWCR